MTPYIHKVNYYETDKMGIVHNSNYLRIFEETRLDQMEKSGIPYPELEAAGIIIPQTEAFVKYITTAKYGDTLSCSVDLVRFDGIKMEYSYKIMLDGTGTMIASGRTVHCFLDNETRFPVSIRKKLPEFYNILLSSTVKDECKKGITSL